MTTDGRIDAGPPGSPWEHVGRVMRDAETIEKLAALFREGGVPHAAALERAVEAFERGRRGDDGA